jgi:predicted dehydrogenase
MVEGEKRRSDRIDAVAIVTPNHVHHGPAKAFMEAGFHVICDKPMTTSLADALDLVATVKRTGQLFGLTHNYTGYPMIRQAREMVASGELGTIRVVQAEYPQEWLTERIEAAGQKQAAWRTDPARSGPAGSVGDIGTHAYNLACFVTGMVPASLAADISSFVEGRQLDDDANIMLRYAEGARGSIWASQVAPGNENGLRLRVYGTKGGLDWLQAEPNKLWYAPFGKPTQLLTRGGHGALPVAAHATRVPSGHPEGYLEGFAQIYKDMAEQIGARIAGRSPDPFSLAVPTVEDGARGVKFIEATVESSRKNAAWTSLDIAL